MEVDGPEPDEEVLACLAGLTASSGELFHQLTRLSHCLAMTKGEHRPGPSYTQMMPLEDRLATVAQISAAITTVIREGSRFRRLEARALYAEGLTMAELATVFGVSRQRVSALLRHTEDSARAGPQPGAPATRANI